MYRQEKGVSKSPVYDEKVSAKAVAWVAYQ